MLNYQRVKTLIEFNELSNWFPLKCRRHLPMMTPRLFPIYSHRSSPSQIASQLQAPGAEYTPGSAEIAAGLACPANPRESDDFNMFYHLVIIKCNNK